MEIKIEEWKISKSGRSANLFAGAEKYYMPLKKVALKVGDESPDFEGAIFTVQEGDLFVNERNSWIRVNRFQRIELKSGEVLDWKSLLGKKKEMFGKKDGETSKVGAPKASEDTFEFMNPGKW